MSDYGSDIDDETADTLLRENDSDYGSDLDEETANTLLNETTPQPVRTALQPGNDVDYGSDLDDDTADALVEQASRIPMRRGFSYPQADDSSSTKATPQRPGRSTSLKPARTGICETQTQCPLLGLPPEIRNVIYEHVFCDHTVRLNKIKPTKRDMLGLLLTSKQIHREAVGIFYSTAIFSAVDPQILIRRLGNLPYRHRKAIRRVRMLTHGKFRDYAPHSMAQLASLLIHDAKKALRQNWPYMASVVVVDASIRALDWSIVWSQSPISTYRTMAAQARSQGQYAEDVAEVSYTLSKLHFDREKRKGYYFWYDGERDLREDFARLKKVILDSLQ